MFDAECRSQGFRDVIISHFRWVVDLEGATGTLYEGEKFQLQFKFGPRYPFDSPQVRVCPLYFMLEYSRLSTGTGSYQYVHSIVFRDIL